MSITVQCWAVILGCTYSGNSRSGLVPQKKPNAGEIIEDDLSFDDILKMGWQRAYKLMHDLVEHEDKCFINEDQARIKKELLIKKAKKGAGK